MEKLLLLLALFCSQFAWGQFGVPSYEDLIKTEIIPEYSSWEKETQRILVKTTISDGFSYYWKNGGESGVPFDIEASLPEGMELLNVVWGSPKYKFFFGQKTYAYVGGSWHLLTVKKKAGLKGEQKIELNNLFQVCDDKNCFAPQTLTFPGSLTIGAEKLNPAFDEQLKKASHYLPQELDAELDVQVIRSDAGFDISVVKPQDDAKVFFFNDSENLMAFDQKWKEEGARLQTHLAFAENADKKDQILLGTLLIKANGSQEAYAVDSSTLSSVTTMISTVSEGGSDEVAVEAEKPSFWITIAYMFIGGLLLNLMPCVFPVLALKVQSFLKLSKDGKGSALSHGLAYSGGVILSFWVLSFFIIILKAKNPNLTWGFQLQDPAFLLGMVILLFVIALNFFGLFEMGVSLTGAGQKVKKEGHGGSFMSGVLATVVATPCAGPFLGAALAATFGMSNFPLLMSFTAMGLGLSLPYLILGFKPELLKFLPRPGDWMERFKQSMGFMMMLAVVYFFWSLAAMIDVDWAIRVLAAMVGLALALWIYGAWGTPWMSAKVRKIAIGLAVLIGGYSLVFAYDASQQGGVISAEVPKEIVWNPYDEVEIQKLEAEGKPYFVDFTAKWCGICQWNKNTAIRKQGTYEAFLAKGVKLFEADMTNENPALSEAIKKYGRKAVPVYVVFDGSEWRVLSSTLTEGSLIEEIKSIP
ncbi:thioredoxin family protein [Lentisphaera profundi]|uniref:Thioredoxin family protein n=1 Tax=Lentisphaera profundi TaxID=1658616 RepID=A0ABY7VR04_9BACT|nr:thioredoxin family protein [Lentisphaera profundi]WDE96633.1 thioredoxin family protein [Lentisphaera profundi]